MIKYRLSLDIGTNSIGWCALALEQKRERERPVSIVDMGVRVFSDGRNPKDGTSNAVTRREARGARRNRDRFVERRNRLIDALVSSGLMPKDEKERRALTELDPYELRARGLDEMLSLYEFGRAIFHLNQRRGFKSNRKSDANNKESGPIKEALRGQRDQMTAIKARTFGEYLLMRRERGASVRARLKTKRVVLEGGKEKSQDYYDFYPGRDLLKEEFDALWDEQVKYHASTLVKAARDRISDIIFNQRPLKPAVVGKCTFERSEDRARKALPLVQRFRIYLELNHLQVLDGRTGRPLRLDERDKLASLMLEPAGKKNGKPEVSFDKMRKKLGLGESFTFSHESEKRKGLEADTTTALLAHKERFGPRWYQFSDEEQEEIVLKLLDTDDEEELIRWLMDGWKLDRKRAEAVANTPLPDGYGRLGVTATRRIVEQLVRDVIPYSEAVQRAGYESHSRFSAGQRRQRLPYYGEVLERHVIPHPEKGGSPEAPLELRFGKVTNPTVHIALNQVRAVVNEVIKLYGVPAEIHVEVLRDLKNSLKQKKEIEAEQEKNQDANDECARRLREEFHLPVNRENIQRMRLWQELPADNRVCPYTGENISCQILFSPEIEIDHILPFSRTLDDSTGNKVLCKRRANREKSNQTPFDAWGSNAERWQDILDRIAILPKNKRWRFSEDAMERYMKDRDFIARQLTDSQYITKLAREYLAVLFDPGEEYKVVCLPGRLTGIFRHHLGMGDILDEVNPALRDSLVAKGEKNRNDHRHHAVDAIVIGLMDRSFLQQAASIHARAEKEGVYEFLDELPEPWDGFRASARDALGEIVVSQKLDHGIQDVLHNATAYGFAKQEDTRGNAMHRVPARDIDRKNILCIKSKHLRAELVAHLSGLPHDMAFQRLEDIDARSNTLEKLFGAATDEKEFKTRIQTFFDQRGIRRVRLIESISLIPIRRHGNRDGVPYKGFKPDGNAYLDIFESTSGMQWEGELVTIFAANTQESAVAHGTRRKVSRLFNRDMLEMEHGGKRRIFYIQKMSEKQIALAEHFEANADSRTRSENDPFKFVYKGGAEPLRKAKVRFLVVTPAGKIRYLSDAPNDSPSG